MSSSSSASSASTSARVSTQGSEEAAIHIDPDTTELISRLKLAPDDGARFVTHFAELIDAAVSGGYNPAQLSKVLKGEAKIWAKEGQCSLVSDREEVPRTLAPHFTAWMSCHSEEDQHGEALIDAGVWPIDDDAPHGDTCRYRAALEEFTDTLTDELDLCVQSFDYDDLDLFCTVSEKEFDDIPALPGRLRERGWDISASGDRFGAASDD